VAGEGNVESVRGLHQGAALVGLFDLLHDDVEWWVLGSPDELPWAGLFRGHEGVRRWSELLNDEMEYLEFEPREFIAGSDVVVELIYAAGRARTTGKPFASDVVRIWTFRDEKAIRVRSFYDTHAYAVAREP
jgi:uncharacterized protein